MLGLFKKIKGSKFIKSIIYTLVGAITYPGFNIINKLQVNGVNHLRNLPKKNVLFVSNHQTYFADVISFIHIFCAVKWRKKNVLGFPYYLLSPYTNIMYVAAEETMKKDWISRLLMLGGAITVKRTWNDGTKEVRRNLDPSDTRKIERALQDNWIVTFPQGTTKPFAPGRKGTAFIIKQYQPIVVPIVINGYWRAFNKKGLKFKKKGTPLSVTFKEPMEIDYNDTVENILEQVMDAIEQSKKFMNLGKHHIG